MGQDDRELSPQIPDVKVRFPSCGHPSRAVRQRQDMYDWVVYNGFRPVIIATKLDKIKRSQIQKQVKLIRTGLGMEKQDILIPFSAETKQGREDVWNLIDKMAAGEDLLTAEEEIQAEKAAEWAAKKAAKEAQQNL